MSLPIFEGYPHSTTVLRSNGLERVLDYDPVNMPVPDLTYATEFVQQCSGLYLKWLNRFGGYKYYLFSEVVLNKVKTKSLKYINNNFNSRVDQLSRKHEIGKEATLTLECFSRIPNTYAHIVEGILYSPEVYLYTDNMPVNIDIRGCGWVKVFVRQGDFNVISSKYNSEELRLKLELPEHYLQTLI